MSKGSHRRHVCAGLFAGVGGVELGLAEAGHEAALLCENAVPAAAVLAARFPGVPVVGDVAALGAVPAEATLLAAGFPCTNLSIAGDKTGIGGAQSSLVGHVFRLLAARRVPNVLIENVENMLRLEGGRAMALIVARLEELGYAWCYRVVNSGWFLPQRRHRVFLVASTEADPRRVLLADEAGLPGPAAPVVGAVPLGFYWTEGKTGVGLAVDGVPPLKGGSGIGLASPPAVLFPDGSVGAPDIRDAERLQGFPEDWTAPAEAVAKPSARWKLVGNAVSVPVAAWIGRRLADPGDYDASADRPLAPGAAWPKAAWGVGGRRGASARSERPLDLPRPSLAAFLRHPPTPLSARAVAGFLARAEAGSLRFPPGFLEALRARLDVLRAPAVP